MGLIKAALAGVGSSMADQWLDYFSCEAIPPDVLALRGVKKPGKNSSNTKSSDNVITHGSGIVVADGQCMIIVEQGVIIEICAEPGQYTYDSNLEPSVFYGGFGAGLKNTVKEMWNRIKHGGGVSHDQRVYYFNTKEIIDNKFGTVNPVGFRVAYADLGRSFTVGVRCNGIYSYKITDPIAFYTNVCGNVSDCYRRSELDNQMLSEFLDSLQPGFAKISQMGVTYDQIPLHTKELTAAMNEELSSRWKELRGLSIVTVAIRSVTISKEDEERIKKYEDLAWNCDPSHAAGVMVGAQAEAMTAAAKNSGGAMTGFFGMGMAQQAGGLNANSLFNMAQQNQSQQQSAAAQDAWKCGCGSTNTGKFCANCGKPKPASSSEWKCECGALNTSKFCANCGKSKPADVQGWSCSCGAVNKGKFCANCGKPKPVGAPLYRCDKCGWEPADPYNPPKFCAECGDHFDETDIVK